MIYIWYCVYIYIIIYIYIIDHHEIIWSSYSLMVLFDIFDIFDISLIISLSYDHVWNGWHGWSHRTVSVSAVWSSEASRAWSSAIVVRWHQDCSVNRVRSTSTVATTEDMIGWWYNWRWYIEMIWYNDIPWKYRWCHDTWRWWI